jgi:hypothetical protein
MIIMYILLFIVLFVLQNAHELGIFTKPITPSLLKDPLAVIILLRIE